MVGGGRGGGGMNGAEEDMEGKSEERGGKERG